MMEMDQIAKLLRTIVSEELDAKLQPIQHRFDAKLQSVQDQLDAKTQSIQDQLNASTQSIQDKFDAKLQSVQDQFDAKIHSVQEQSDANTQSIQHQLGDVKQTVEKMEVQLGEIKIQLDMVASEQPDDTLAMLRIINGKLDSIQRDVEFTYKKTSMNELEINRLKTQ